MQIDNEAIRTRIAQIDADLVDLVRQRRRRYNELRRLPRSELMELADKKIGTHILRGTGPRSRASAVDIAQAIVSAELPTATLERERTLLLRDLERNS